MRRVVALLCFTAGLSGCLTSNVLVTVRPDGSGTVEDTTIVRTSAMAQFQSFVSPELGVPDPVAVSRELQKYAVQTRLGHNLRGPQAPTPPDTEIFLASLSSPDGRLTIGPPINISNNPGYDNQPAFTPDGGQVLFSSARQGSAPPRASATGKPAAPPQTDIYRYEIASRRMWRVTNTPEAEYSPTVMPDGKRISVVRVEADGTQRLWSVTDGDSTGETSLILADIKPVGYHAWIDERRVALFVLGEREQPATLQVADTGTGKAELITTNIGRSLQRMPSGAISFVQREPASGGTAPAAMIMQLFKAKAAERGGISTAPLIRPAGGAADPYLTWIPDGTMLMAVNSTVYRWRIGEPDWTVVADLEGFGLREVSRLAVSPKGDRLAIVARAK